MTCLHMKFSCRRSSERKLHSYCKCHRALQAVAYSKTQSMNLGSFYTLECQMRCLSQQKSCYRGHGNSIPLRNRTRWLPITDQNHHIGYTSQSCIYNHGRLNERILSATENDTKMAYQQSPKYCSAESRHCSLASSNRTRILSDRSTHDMSSPSN